jgi:hypothetical protein
MAIHAVTTFEISPERAIIGSIGRSACRIWIMESSTTLDRLSSHQIVSPLTVDDARSGREAEAGPVPDLPG